MTRDLPYDDDSAAGDNYVEDTAYRIATGVARVARAGAYVTGGALLAAGGTRGASDNANHDSRIVGWSEAEDPKADEPSPTVTFPDLTAADVTPPVKMGPAVVSVSDDQHDNHHYGTDAGFFPGTFGSLPSDATMSGYHGGGFGESGGYSIPQPDYSAAYGYNPQSGVLDGHHGNTGVTIPWGDGQLSLPVPTLPSFDGEPSDFLPGLKIPGVDGHLPGLPGAFLPSGLGDAGLPSGVGPAPANPAPGTDFDGVGDSGIGLFVKTQWNVDAHVGLDGVWFKSDMKVEFNVGDVGHQYTEYQQQIGQYMKDGGPVGSASGTQAGANPFAANGDSGVGGAANPAAATANPATAGASNPAAGGTTNPATAGAANPAAADANPALAGVNGLGGQTFGKSADDAHGSAGTGQPAGGHAPGSGGASAPGGVGAGGASAPGGIGAGGASAPGGIGAGGASAPGGIGSGGVSPQGGFGSGASAPGTAMPGSIGAPAGSPAPAVTAPAAPAFTAPVAPIAVAPVVPAAVAPVSVAPVAVAQPVVATPLQTTIQPDAAQHPIANLLGASGGPSPLTVPAVNAPSLFADHRAPVLVADGSGNAGHSATMVAKPAPAAATPGTAVPQVSVPAKPEVAVTTVPSLPVPTKLPAVETGGATITPGAGGGTHGGATGGATTGGGASTGGGAAGGVDTDGPTGGATTAPGGTRPGGSDPTGTHGGGVTVPSDPDGGTTAHVPTTQPSVPTPDVTVPTVAPTTQPQVTQPHLPSQEITVPSVAPQPTVATQPTVPKPAPAKPIADTSDSAPHVLAAVSGSSVLPVDDALLYASDTDGFGAVRLADHSNGYVPGDSSAWFVSDSNTYAGSDLSTSFVSDSNIYAASDSSASFVSEVNGYAGDDGSVHSLSGDAGWHATASLYGASALNSQLLPGSALTDDQFPSHGVLDHTMLL
ncbi:hypothetical protein LTV02_38900 [Nocardia yamanashiensis]|uniref:hypothetical protein n=1 Tax=Nocardia yamanashiensis TaxID=209247 RepID=UPI001E30A35C|nr:hypothetical protein [Nocardia yamanashiensis]UGT41805.1 hypothetical protein LTV02_38900 [Nocardia yamanashiensis]